MIGKKCMHRDYGCIGKITLELKGNGEYPEQWGIYWFQGQRNFGSFWNDKDRIEILE